MSEDNTAAVGGHSSDPDATGPGNPRGGDWTLRQIAEHVSDVRYYAEQVGALADQRH
jgi:hypothetical protein